MKIILFPHDTVLVQIRTI